MVMAESVSIACTPACVCVCVCVCVFMSADIGATHMLASPYSISASPSSASASLL